MNNHSQNTDYFIKKYWLYFTAVFIALFIAAYWIPLKGMVNVWINNDDYSYGFLIPFFSLYLFWDLRHRINGLELKPSWGIFPLLFLFVLISIYGILGSSGHISRPATPIIFTLFFAFILGIKAFKYFSLPLCFLIFMVPLPSLLDRTFGVFLKAVSSQLGVMLIRLSGLSVYRSGNVIDLGVTQLQVVDACSGLRFVFPLLAIGVVYAYFFEKILWKRIFCVVATVPIAIFTNGLRIGITGILTHYFGPEMAEGFFHDFSGLAIFFVAFVFLFILGRMLRWLPPKNLMPKKDSKELSKNSNKGIKFHTSIKYSFILSCIILAVVFMLGLSTGALPPVKLKNGITAIPLSFKDWQGKLIEVEPDIIDASGAEEAFYAVYRNDKNEEVSLYIGYRSTSFLENENFFHSPTVCLPSSGWKNKSQTRHEIEKISFDDNFKVTQMIIEQMDLQQLVYFWFQTKDKATFSKDINRFHLAIHAIKNDNTHDLFIRLISPMNKNEPIAEAQKRMDKFARDMMDMLLVFLDENIVKE